MTDPITTPAQMREAAALAVANIEIGYHDGIGGDWHPYNGLHIISAACAAIRALPVADPLCTWPSCGHTAKGQCNPTFALPVADRQAIRDQALEDAARVADHYAEADYCAMNYPEEGGIAASGTADMIRREIRVMKGKPE